MEINVSLWSTDDGRSAVTLFRDGFEEWTRSTGDHAMAARLARTLAGLYATQLEDRRAAPWAR